MLKVEYQKWELEIDDLRRLAIESPHKRTRERFAALYDIAQGSNATQVASKSKRNHQTVQSWVHRVNADGPNAMVYRRTGGRPSLRLRSLG